MSLGDFAAFLVLSLAVYCLESTSGSSDNLRICHSCNTSKDCSTGDFLTETCNPESPAYCHTAWNVSGGNVTIVSKGCWLQNDAACNQTACVGNPRLKWRSDIYFCCCKENFCNTNESIINATGTPDLTHYRSPFAPTTIISTTTDSVTATKSKTIQTLLYSVVPIFGFAVILVFGFFMYHRHKTTFPTRIFEEEPLHTIPPPSPELGFRPIQLVEVVSQGQFGTVWKANYLEDTVAVKVFPSAHKSGWVCEKDIFMSCNMKHEHILKFVAVEKHTDGLYSELWLITQYHEHGSLADYLKRHVISWTELCAMAGSIASGLSYLHTEIPGASFKPCIAHRDLKSKNILVKKDLACCLSDFGLAIKFQPGRDPGETHGQVGTKRYMAPEVLEGAISFTQESFLYIDVYALALVLWELASRCTVVDGPVDEYMMPFEEEVGAHPSLEDMQQAVVQKKIRPAFRQDWFAHTGMAGLLQTVDECWDQDAEARLTAQCVAERIAQFSTLTNSGTEHSPAVTTVINNTNTLSSRESII